MDGRSPRRGVPPRPRAYGPASGLPEDRYGISYNMRGYYGFSWTRFEHAVAPTTPAVIIETGFLTSSADRPLIVDDPERARLPDESLVPVTYPPMEVAADNAALRYFPDPAERVRTRLASGRRVRVVDQENGWNEVIVWGNFRVFGWMKDTDLRPLTQKLPGIAAGPLSRKSGQQ